MYVYIYICGRGVVTRTPYICKPETGMMDGRQKSKELKCRELRSAKRAERRAAAELEEAQFADIVEAPVALGPPVAALSKRHCLKKSDRSSAADAPRLCPICMYMYIRVHIHMYIYIFYFLRYYITIYYFLSYYIYIYICIVL